MASWSKDRVEPNAINGGREFTRDDNLALNELNAIVNNSFYASEKSAEALGKINDIIEHEQGTVVTINDSPQAEWKADFAESERQKSKNLLNPKIQPATVYRIAWANDNDYITINGTAWEEGYSEIFTTTPLNISAGKTYTFSVHNSNAPSEISIGIWVYDEQNNLVATFSKKQGYTHTLSANAIKFKPFIEGTIKDTTYNFKFKFQLEDGPVATDYQVYNGAIVHEKDILDIEHIETIYDMNSADANINKGYTSGIQANTGATTYQFGITKEKYKRIIVDASLDSMNTSVEIEVLGEDDQQGGLITTNIRDSSFGISTMSFRLYANGDFKCIFARYQTPTNQYDKNNTATYIITRIRGVKA